MATTDSTDSIAERHAREGELLRHGRRDMDAIADDVADDPTSEPRKILSVIRRSHKAKARAAQGSDAAKKKFRRKLTEGDGPFTPWAEGCGGRVR